MLRSQIFVPQPWSHNNKSTYVLQIIFLNNILKQTAYIILLNNKTLEGGPKKVTTQILKALFNQARAVYIYFYLVCFVSFSYQYVILPRRWEACMSQVTLGQQQVSFFTQLAGYFRLLLWLYSLSNKNPANWYCHHLAQGKTCFTSFCLG